MAEAMNPGLAPFAPSDRSHLPLRVGILVSGPSDYQLLIPVLQAVERSTFARLILVINQRVSPADRRAGRVRPGILGRLYRRWDDRSNAHMRIDQRAAASELLRRLPAVALQSGTDLTDVERKEIHAHDLDVILSCSTPSSRTLGACARCGVWSIGLSGADGAALPVHAFFSQVNGNPISRISLIADNGPASSARVLGRSVGRQPTTLSLAKALQAQGCTAAELVLWKLWQLHERGWEALGDDPAPRINRPKHGFPIATRALLAWGSLLGSWIGRSIAEAIKPAGTREWQIGLRRATGALPWEGSWEDFHWIDAHPGHYLADPFLFEHEGVTWLFAEDYDYATRKGSLACAPLDSDGRAGAWLSVLDLSVHLSFPCVFAHEGDVYLIPESQAGGRVDLYRSTDFPRRWVRLQTLWDGPALDTVPYRADDGCWYFFTSVQTDGVLPPQLLLFTAPDLRAPWRLHPASPLSLDIRYARNGGRIIDRVDSSGKRRLYRISQDGSGKYGSKLHFHQIDVLTPERYAERRVATRLPPTDRDGTHHYDCTGAWEAVDATAYATAPRRRRAADDHLARAGFQRGLL